MKRVYTVFFLLIILSSCAKIPIQSISLVDAIAEEGNRMHQLNLSLLNGIFKSKRERIDEFIRTQYSPKFISDFQKNIPKEADLKTELPNIINAVTPRITERRDAMQNALEEQRIKLVAKIEQDYKAFDNAATVMRKLLVSATKINEEKQALFEKTKELSKGSLDLNAVESTIDKFINSGGNVGNEVSNLNDTINTIIKR